MSENYLNEPSADASGHVRIEKSPRSSRLFMHLPDGRRLALTECTDFHLVGPELEEGKVTDPLVVLSTIDGVDGPVGLYYNLNDPAQLRGSARALSSIADEYEARLREAHSV